MSLKRGRVAVALQALAVLLVGIAAPALATEDLSSQPGTRDFEEIDSYVQGRMEQMRMPGSALGIVQGDKIVHLQGFGAADASGRDVSPQTPFKIGSTSKSFTAVAIMQLAEAGEIDLDAPVRRYLPWFHVADVDASKHITVRHLLNQTSGIPTAAGLSWMYQADDSKAALEKVVRAASQVELTHAPGDVWQYSNLNYTTLGLIVQTVSNETYERYVEEHVLAPLRMEDSFAFMPEAQRQGLATGHQFWFGRPIPGGGLAYNRATTPTGLIASSARDMSTYLIAHLNQGRYRDVQILSAAGMAELHRGAVEIDGEASYAMGWMASTFDHLPILMHNGDTGDFHTTMVLEPEGKLGVVLMMNGSNSLDASLDATAYGVLSRLTGAEPPSSPGLLHNKVLLLVLGVLAVVGFQALGVIRSVVILRRWRAKNEQRPRGGLTVSLRIGLPLFVSLLWAVGLFAVLLPAISMPISVIAMIDVGWVILLSGGLALAWGVVLRPVLALLALRATVTDGPSPSHETPR